jgi:hypothetical protein
MIHRYIINTKKSEQLKIPNNTPQISIDNCNFSWGINGDSRLEKIIIDITGRPVMQDDKGNILSSYSEIDAIAFNMATFLSNSIFIQTSIDAIDPYKILANSPELISESDEEDKLLKDTPKTAYNSLTAEMKVLGQFNPQRYITDSDMSVAIAHFAAAWRTNNRFHKFESFFKVIESIFKKGKNEDSDDFDSRLSKYASKIDNRFTIDVIKNLRQIRNRCVHPDNPIHLSPEDLIAVREVGRSLKMMELLARLSIDNPPQVPGKNTEHL